MSEEEIKELYIGVYNYPTEHWLKIYENYPTVKGIIAWKEIVLPKESE